MAWVKLLEGSQHILYDIFVHISLELELHMHFYAFFRSQNPVLNFLNFLSSRSLLSYKTPSYREYVYFRLINVSVKNS